MSDHKTYMKFFDKCCNCNVLIKKNEEKEILLGFFDKGLFERYSVPLNIHKKCYEKIKNDSTWRPYSHIEKIKQMDRENELMA